MLPACLQHAHLGLLLAGKYAVWGTLPSLLVWGANSAAGKGKTYKEDLSAAACSMRIWGDRLSAGVLPGALLPSSMVRGRRL